MNTVAHFRRADPAVAVVMPVHNGEAFLSQAVESILAQGFGNFEFIVVDDASSDCSFDVLQQFSDERLTVIRNQVNRGVAESLNIGIAQAKAPLIARMDADDLAHPDRLKLQVEFMANQPGVVLLGTEAERIDASGRVTRYIKRLYSDVEIRWHLLTANPFIHPSVVFRADAFRQTGGYEPALRCAQDYDLWCRLSLLGKCANLPQCLLSYRFHGGAISANKRAEQLRFTKQRSRRYLIESGVVRSEPDAEVFWAFSRFAADPGGATNYSRRECERYGQIVEQFLDGFEAVDSETVESLKRCRKRIARKLKEQIRTSMAHPIRMIRLYQLARRFDPSLNPVARVAHKVRNRVFGRESHGAPTLQERSQDFD